MAEFLDSFDVERDSLLSSLAAVEDVWARFQERRTLEVEGTAQTASLIAGELAHVRRDLELTKFNVGIFGLIKRGKSTLLNGLIGREVSSMHVTPETAVPVYVSYGEHPEAVVHFAGGTRKHVAVEDVHEYTSQKSNPMNELGVTYVEQQVPVSFLRNGTRLIDTPGLDDAEADDVYAERTLQELDVVDAGVVLFLSPPTVGATELKFLEQVVARDLTKTFLVCNMYPQHFHDPDTRRQVLEYVGMRIVEATVRAGRAGEVRVYPVCALEAWQSRQNDDIDLWKRSGADRLMRDVENYLSDHAGQEVLSTAAERIAHIAELARAEVQIRQQLLEDPEKLQGFRQQLDRDILDLERRFEAAVSTALAEVSPLHIRIRGLVLQPFNQAKKDLAALETLEELEQFSSRFRRRLEVAGELASRRFSEGSALIIDGLQHQLQERFQSVMSDLAPNLPTIRLSSQALLVTPDQLQQLQAAQRRSAQASRTSALVGGVSGGGMALVAAGAMLGPLGLLGGALAGWKLASVVAGHRNLEQARAQVEARLDEIAAMMLHDVDKQVEQVITTVRAAVERRRRAFAADLYQQFEVVQAIIRQPETLETHRREAARFDEAFQECAAGARRAMSPRSALVGAG